MNSPFWCIRSKKSASIKINLTQIKSLVYFFTDITNNIRTFQIQSLDNRTIVVTNLYIAIFIRSFIVYKVPTFFVFVHSELKLYVREPCI